MTAFQKLPQVKVNCSYFMLQLLTSFSISPAPITGLFQSAPCPFHIGNRIIQQTKSWFLTPISQQPGPIVLPSFSFLPKDNPKSNTGTRLCCVLCPPLHFAALGGKMQQHLPATADLLLSSPLELGRRLRHADKLRRSAFFSVALGSAASIASILLVPLIYTYAQRVQSALQPELQMCRGEARRMWREYQQTESFVAPSASGQRRRQPRHPAIGRPFDAADWSGGLRRSEGVALLGAASRRSRTGAAPAAQPYLFDSILPQCCQCGIGEAGTPGQPGPPGMPGTDGRQGMAGLAGADGIPGAPLSEQEWCFDCPQAETGPRGPQGGKGPDGAPGLDGRPGNPGKRGPPGTVGQPGLPGLPGLNGPVGPRGEPGKLIEHPAPKGPSGLPGIDGPPGQPGEDGRPGKQVPPGPPGPLGGPGMPGQPGRNGPKGAPGKHGQQGSNGGCDHCPPPRLADGYEAGPQPAKAETAAKSGGYTESEPAGGLPVAVAGRN